MTTAPQPEGPSAYIASKLESIISGHSINEDDADWLRALAAPEVPAPVAEPHWQIDLTADAAETLKQSIGSDDCVSPITLSLCEGREGRGLYVWQTEYPDEGSLLLCAAPAVSPPPAAQEVPQEVVRDAMRYRWLAQFLSIDDVGDETAAYGLVIDGERIEEEAWRACLWSAVEFLENEPTVEDAIDRALASPAAPEGTQEGGAA